MGFMNADCVPVVTKIPARTMKKTSKQNQFKGELELKALQGQEWEG